VTAGCDCEATSSPLTERQDDLNKRVSALEEKLDFLTKRVLDYVQLKKLYDESRDYVRQLIDERDDLIEANKQHVAEVNTLDAEIERMRPVYEAAKLSRQSIPCDAAELRERSFHPSTCDLVEAVDRAIAAEPKTSPYR